MSTHLDTTQAHLPDWTTTSPGRLHSRYPGETLLGFHKDPVGYLERLANEYGDIVRFKLGPLDTFLVNHPALIKDILVTQNRNFRLGYGHKQARHFFGDGLVTSEGELHLCERRLIEPMFHAKQISKSADTTVEFGERWRSERRDGEVLVIDHAMWALTLDLICKSLFNTSVRSEIDEINQAVRDVTGLFSPMMMLMATWILKLHLPPSGQFRRAQARLDRTMYRIIDEHRASGDQGDLLSMLLKASENSNMLDERQIHDEMLTFFIAGHGTSAGMLTWTFLLLAQHPEIEARLCEEVDQVLGGRLPTLNDLPNLKYARGVLTEALRLYPPVWGMDREVVRECEVGGQTLPKGALVLMSQWVTHHDARFFPEPYRFEPARWLESEPARYTFFPFSTGPRVCVGEAMTWMNGTLLLSTIIQKWRLRLEPGQNLMLVAGTSLMPRNGVQMRLQARS